MNDKEKYEAKYANIYENDNVSKGCDFTEFFKLAGFVVLIFAAAFLILSVSINVYIANLSQSGQEKLEDFLSSQSGSEINKMHPRADTQRVKRLEAIKHKILAQDDKLKNSKRLKLYEVESDDVNAFVNVNGNIYFTNALLNEVKNERALAFVLAHEIGHYSNRHHLHGFANTIALLLVSSAFSLSGQNSATAIVNGLVDFTSITYSKSQETAADMYANNVIKKLYGTNTDAVEFFKYLDKKDKSPRFLYFFATHPEPKERIEMLIKN